MDLVDDIKLYLPQYLSALDRDKMMEQIREFTQQGSSNLYTSNYSHSSNLWQGDGIDNMIYVNLPDLQTNELSVMILSNTCDICLDNKRMYGNRVLYAPIINLSKFEANLKTQFDEQRVDALIRDIKKQQITQILYLPIGYGMNEEGLVFFDRTISLPLNTALVQQMTQNHKFSLNNFGFYLLLLKLSIHYTRVQEKLERTTGQDLGGV